MYSWFIVQLKIFELIQLLICNIQKMRRQIGSETSKAISKSISKAKKNKHTTTQQPEHKDKRADRQIFKVIYHQSPIKQLSFIFSQLDQHRLNQKIAQIEMFAQKMLDSQQKKRLQEMASIIVQQERIHNLIQSYVKQNNHEKARQQAQMMKRIQDKKKQFFKEANNRYQAINITSGVFANELIARQGSPKMKLQMMGFSDFSKKTASKKQSEYALELKNKDMIINRLFQRIELLEISNNKFDRQKSFKQNMECINSRYVYSQRKNMKMARQVEQMQSKKEQVINEIQKYRNEYNQLLYDYDRLNQKYLDLEREFKQENMQKEQLERKHKEFEHFCSENEELKQKYQDLQEQFNFSIEEKFEWERRYNKILKESNLQQQKIIQLKAKIKQFLQDEVPELRNIIKITQNRLKQFLELIKTFMAERFQDFCKTLAVRYQDTIKQQAQRQKQFVQILAEKTKECQDLSIQARKQSQKQKNHYDQIIYKTKLCDKLVEMTEVFQMNITKMKNQHAEYRKNVEDSRKQRKNRLSLISDVLEYTLSWQTSDRPFNITNFQILHFQGLHNKSNVSIQTNQQKLTLSLQSSQSYFVYQANDHKQTQQFGIQTQENENNVLQCIKIEVACQTIYLEKQASSMQTDLKMTKQADTQYSLVQKISVFTQTHPINQFIRQNVVSLALERKKSNNLNFIISNAMQIQILTNVILESAGVQTQEQEAQPSQNYLDFKIIEEQQFNCCSQNDILKMLADAEDCTIIPDITILRQQIITYRDQIEKLKNVIRQHQKQKQEENVFNFRL